MSVCDTCPQPGHCCQNIALSGGDGLWLEPHEPSILLLVAMARFGLPFLPIDSEVVYDSGSGTRTHRFTCPLLGADGRCTDYAHRPELCRAYQPRSDRLCILHPSHTETTP